MGISSFLRIFQPKDSVFNHLFQQVSDNLLAMSVEMMQKTASSETINQDLLRKMEDYEHANDKLTHDIFVELEKNFITPFDREDIHHLASSLDDIADFMYGSVKYIMLYQAPFNPFYHQFSILINQSVTVLQKAIYLLKDLKNTKEIAKCCVEINRLENLSDDLFSKELSKLFNSKMDVLDIIKVKGILENLEDVNDKCEDSANIIESILVKYS